MESQHQKYLFGLTILLLLFLFRVCAQLVQAVYPVDFLPSFNAWYSGVMHYRYLFLSQVVIIIVMLNVLKGFYLKTIVPKYNLGKCFFIFGSIYFSVMFFRLIAGLTFASSHPWFGAKIPAFFHLVLASFVLLIGHFHLKNGGRE